MKKPKSYQHQPFWIWAQDLSYRTPTFLLTYEFATSKQEAAKKARKRFLRPVAYLRFKNEGNWPRPSFQRRSTPKHDQDQRDHPLSV